MDNESDIEEYDNILGNILNASVEFAKKNESVLID
jgi:hypothetical protein